MLPRLTLRPPHCNFAAKSFTAIPRQPLTILTLVPILFSFFMFRVIYNCTLNLLKKAPMKVMAPVQLLGVEIRFCFSPFFVLKKRGEFSQQPII
jgi:hypothetical protein